MKQVNSEAFLSLHYGVISSTLSIHYDGKEKTESALKMDTAGAEIPNYCLFSGSSSLWFILFSLF